MAPGQCVAGRLRAREGRPRHAGGRRRASDHALLHVPLRRTTEGATLLINAFTGGKGGEVKAQQCLDEYRERVNRYAAAYRHGMEQLMVTYYGDQTLLGFCSSREWEYTGRKPASTPEQPSPSPTPVPQQTSAKQS